MKDYDIYMPDHQTAREFGGKTKPEDREKLSPPSLEFQYDNLKDVFTCPEGKNSSYKIEKNLHNVNYTEFHIYGCKSCPLVSVCAGHNSNQKSIMIKTSDLPEKEKHFTRSQGIKGPRVPNGKLTRAMLKKAIFYQGMGVKIKEMKT